ncbi:MAG TPA: serine hydrolase [Thermoanaerobaculia bacterium]|nr:serine hydrolase [Thermoanaerobaculia bacterium]
MKLWKLVVLTALLALPLHAQTIDTRAVDRLVTETIAAWKIPGAAIAIVQNDRVIYLKGYGVKENGGGAVTPDTLFQIASTSKAFTSAALAILVDDKKLQWDDPVRQHVDYFRLADPCASSMVTLRDIVSHRTGLSRHDELWDNAPWTTAEVVRMIGDVELSKSFRSTYQYQNVMFMAAGEAVTSASGMPWSEFVKTRIFTPLAMTSTRVSDADWNASTDRASGHRYDRKTDSIIIQKPIDTTALAAAGAIKSNAHDMANWVRMQLGDGLFDGKRVISAEALNETKTPQTVIRIEGLTRETSSESNLMAYGMGWTIQDYHGELLVSHAGALNGFRTHVDLLPKQKFGFAILINAGRGYALIAMRNALIDMLLARPQRDWSTYFLALDKKSDEQDEAKKRERDAKRNPNTKPSQDLAAYAGTYESRGYGSATISLVNGSLLLRWSRLAIPLTHFHYDTFSALSEADDVDEQVTFAIGADGAIQSMTLFGETFVRK